jgi:predicted unusual protein kinase regulating ubiquinone biosynthesis (AarF/ABC1/UbiB family)
MVETTMRATRDSQSKRLSRLRNPSLAQPFWRRWWRTWSVLRLLLWTIWVIYRERKRVIRAHQRGNYEVQPNVEVLVKVLVEFRQMAIKLGVLMIKLGQFLSARADLLPEQALSVLASLQDEVPPEPFEHVLSVIEEEQGRPADEIFRVLESQCTAAASIGQVHKAVLASTGETVAVKVQRPGIETLVRMDLGALKFVIWLITRFIDTNSFIDLWGLFREFQRTVYTEIDFSAEAKHARRFREMFVDEPAIYIPRVYEEYVTRHMLVLEWIDGIKINDYARLDACSINRLEVARRTVNAYFRQFFEEGFFHADPHPGNIFVKRGSKPGEPVIAFVDFGMVGNITRPMRRAMRELFLGLIARDTHMVVSALLKLGFIGAGANTTVIERSLAVLLEEYHGLTLGQFRDLNMADLAQDVIGLLYGQPFHIPAQFAFSGRAVSTLVGVTTGLAPDFNFVEEAKPYARHFLGLDVEGAGETLQELARQLLETGRILLTLPRSIERLITKVENGQVEVRLGNLLSDKRARGRLLLLGAGERSGSISLVLAVIGALASGIYLMTVAQLPGPGWFCLGLAGVLGLGMVLRR